MNMRASVMLVDDDEDVIEIGTIVLESHGFRVCAAKDGLDALQMLEQEEPQLILLDLMMPRMNGEEFLKELRAGNKHNIPVVLMSGHSEALAIARVLSVDAVLCKPVDLDALVKTVGDLIAKRNHPPSAI